MQSRDNKIAFKIYPSIFLCLNVIEMLINKQKANYLWLKYTFIRSNMNAIHCNKYKSGSLI